MEVEARNLDKKVCVEGGPVGSLLPQDYGDWNGVMGAKVGQRSGIVVVSP